MSRKRTVRKVWPRVNPLAMALQGCRPIDDQRLAMLRASEQAAIEAFRTGAATVDHWNAIADVCNVAQTMCRMGIGRDEVMPVTEAVEHHLADAHSRFERTGRVATTGEGLRAFTDLCEFMDLQRTAVDLRTYERAIAATINRIRGAHPDVKVLISETSEAKAAKATGPAVSGCV